MSKHTQGKWIAVGDWVELDDDTRADICSVNPCDFGQISYGRNYDEMRANARLIAAAPDHLFQLLAAANYIDALGGDSKSYRAAIKAAEGEA